MPAKNDEKTRQKMMKKAKSKNLECTLLLLTQSFCNGHWESALCQLLKKKRLGVDVHMRGMSSGIRLKTSSNYAVSLYELLKSYSQHTMKKNFLSINIVKLPVFTTEQAIEIIKKNIKNLNNWKEISELVPKKFKETKTLKKSGIAGLFSASLELTKEGLISIMQKKSFDKLLIRNKNE